MSPKKIALLCAIAFLVLFLSASAFADFQVSSFELDTSKVFVKPGLSETVAALVSVRNLGSGTAPATVEIVVKGPDGIVIAGQTKTFRGSFGQDSTLISFSPGNSFAIPGDWEPGNYTFYASVYDGVPPVSLDDQKIRVLTLQINKPVPVPELDFALLPLIAFSALALLFLSGKRK